VRSWAWENVWLVFSITSLVVLPWVLALSLVDHLLNLYATLPFSVLVLPFAMGMGWGVAQILFGISVQRLGLALAYAVIVGLGAVLGTLVPFFARIEYGQGSPHSRVGSRRCGIDDSWHLPDHLGWTNSRS